MKKKLLALVVLFIIVFNFNLTQNAFGFNTNHNLNAVIRLWDLDMIAIGDTTKIIVRRSESISPEKPFKYSNTPLNHDMSFDLKPISKRKFSVSFLNQNHARIAVKIYDVIGNLIIEDNVTGKGYFYKEYDLSFYNTDLFIIEVGNSKYNKTKSLVSG